MDDTAMKYNLDFSCYYTLTKQPSFNHNVRFALLLSPFLNLENHLSH